MSNELSSPSNFWTSEAVSSGHPDKVADQIADAILDAYIAQDPYARVACEVTLCKDYVLITGEVGSKKNPQVNHIEIAKAKLREIGYDSDANSFNCNTAEFVDKINKQSEQISSAVIKFDGDIGAGDQGMAFGYACWNESSNHMPFSHFLSFQLIKALEEDRKTNKNSIFRPDAKTQVTLKLDPKNKFSSSCVDTVLVSTCHKENISRNELNAEVHRVIDPVLEKYIPKQKPNILINPAGLWTIGGPAADTGLSGRKIVVDQYGSDCPVGGGSFCVDSETEYLTKTGWKKISCYENGEEIAQYHEDGNISFIIPEEYISVPAERMFRLETKKTVDQVLSSGHNVVYISSKGNLNKKPFFELKEQHESSVSGSHALIPASFTYAPNTIGIQLSDDEIRLQIAAISDGCHKYKKGKSCRFRFKKSRKILRMRELLKSLSIDGNERILSDGYTYFTLNSPTEDNHFPKEFWLANSNQLKVIAEELFHWDGDLNKLIYRTTSKSDADFAQFVLMSVYGTRVSILEDDRMGDLYGDNDQYTRKSICYEVTVCKNKLVTLRNPHSGKAKISGYIPPDGKQYCFTVPTGMLVLRRNDKVFVTGNSGKDCTKVDRSGAYAARWVAKNIVAQGYATECQVQISYAIGVPKPVGLTINCFGTNKFDLNIIHNFVNDNFDLSPKAIIDKLNLRRPIYSKTASGGHFGNNEYPWEQII
jgi:S-adenosylmethionine synthetase